MRWVISPSICFLGYTLFLSTATALLVVPGSNCAIQCGNVPQSNSAGDITCGDSSFSSVAGQTFQNCISCEMNSTYVDYTSKQTDLQWLLYNLRYAANYCIFNVSTISATPCVTGPACGAFQPALTFDSNPANSSTYGYCSAWRSDLLPKCQACLQSIPGEQVLNNFITALDIGCQQKPSPGNLLSIQGSLFSSTPVIAGSPSSAPAAGSAGVPTGKLALGAILGIVFGVLAGVCIIIGICIVCFGKRRRRRTLEKFNRDLNRDSFMAGQHNVSGSQGMQDMSPHSNSALVEPYKWHGNYPEYSPESAVSEQTFFSPYISPVTPEVTQRGWQARDYNDDTIEMDRLRQKEAGKGGFVPAAPPVIRYPSTGKGGTYYGESEVKG